MLKQLAMMSPTAPYCIKMMQAIIKKLVFI